MVPKGPHLAYGRLSAVRRLAPSLPQNAFLMARGWESKSVEAQQDAAADRRRAAQAPAPADGARSAERATLMLARTRALADLQLACAPAHRAMLEQAIAELDRKLASLAN